MIAIVDYGIGNIMSLMALLEGEDVVLTDDPETLMRADVMILPGVGAFGYAMAALVERKLDVVVKAFAQTGKPLIGICLGMQLLYESSEEHGTHQGLGLLKGQIVSLPDDLVKPHMGWNLLSNAQAYMYFVHSYYATDVEPSTVLATTRYGTDIPAVVQSGNLIGFQGHPEKSGAFGRALLKEVIQTGEVKL